MKAFKKVLLIAVLIASIGVHAEEAEFKTMLTEAKKVFKTRKFADAQAAFEKALKAAISEDEQADCLIHLGRCMQYQGKYAEAAKYFSKAVELEDIPVYMQYQSRQLLVQALGIKGKNVEAVKIAQDALKMENISPAQKVNLLYLLGVAQMKSGKDDDALKTFASLLATKGATDYWKSAAHIRILTINKRKNDTAGAIATCEKIIALKGAPAGYKKIAQKFIDKNKAKPTAKPEAKK